MWFIDYFPSKYHCLMHIYLNNNHCWPLNEHYGNKLSLCSQNKYINIANHIFRLANYMMHQIVSADVVLLLMMSLVFCIAYTKPHMHLINYRSDSAYSENQKATHNKQLRKFKARVSLAFNDRLSYVYSLFVRTRLK